MEAGVEQLREQIKRLTEENAQLEEEKARLNEENDTLKSRCQKLARAAASQEKPASTEVGVQTESDASAETSSAEVGARIPPMVEQMLRSPQDEAVQLQCVEALFAQQTQVDGLQDTATAAGTQASLEAAIAIFKNHPGNHPLLLKASQFLSVVLSEPATQHQLPATALFQAAHEIVSLGDRLLSQGLTIPVQGSQPGKQTKLLAWCLSLLALLFPCLGVRLGDQGQSQELIGLLLNQLVGPLLASAEFPQKDLMLKCMQLLPLLPMPPWMQKACLDSGAVHSLVLAFHRCASSGNGPQADLVKAIQDALRCVFSQNLELCVRAMDDTFVSDEFVCLEVLDELRAAERKQRGAFRALDAEWAVVRKALGLWAFHQRRALEDSDPLKSRSREVLQKVAELLSAVLVKLTPQTLLERMQEFENSEALQRIALVAIHSNPQLRLQLAVNYVDNDVARVVIVCLQMLLRHYDDEVPPEGADVEEHRSSAEQRASTEAAFQLLQDDKLPAEAWPYVQYCLEICLHILSHWSAAKLSLQQKADVLDARAAPLMLAQGGLVDVLAEIIDPVAADFQLRMPPPQAVRQQAVETLQALFEQNAHVCLFCMQHYTEVKLMIAMGCDSLCMDPLAAFPDMQQQAVEQLSASFEKFSAGDEKLGRKILKALANLFESSYRLVAWFLKEYSLSTLGSMQGLDVHIEACRAVARAPYWGAEDAPLLPELVVSIARLLLGGVQGLAEAAPANSQGRVLDVTEAEEVAAACMSALLHLLLIDPSPPTALRCLVRSLGDADGEGSSFNPPPRTDASETGGSELAVNNVMKIMQVFPSSDRVQMNCQHLLTSLLGE